MTDKELNDWNKAFGKPLVPDREEALKEALHALNWMWENMEVTNKNLQSDSFNIPANAIATIERALGIRKD